MNTEELWISAELVRLRGERRVLVELMLQLLSVVLTIEAETDEEQARMSALIKQANDALSAVHADASQIKLPGEPPEAAMGVLIGYDSIDHLNDSDQQLLRERATARWIALLKACDITPLKPSLLESQIEAIYQATLQHEAAPLMSDRNWLQLGVCTAEGYHGIVDKAAAS